MLVLSWAGLHVNHDADYALEIDYHTILNGTWYADARFHENAYLYPQANGTTALSYS